MAKRIVLHVDMDFFYAQVEERENPALKGKPVRVCMISGRKGSLGAVATCNYTARAKGVHSGMPCVIAKKKAPDVVFLPARKDFYVQESDEIMDYLEGMADISEQVSVDEAYLDVSESSRGDYKKAAEIAGEIKTHVLEHQKLTCSVGIGPNKLVAKIASGFKKPDGLTLVKDDEVIEFSLSHAVNQALRHRGQGGGKAERIERENNRRPPEARQRHVRRTLRT